jgi:hypothetical protein
MRQSAVLVLSAIGIFAGCSSGVTLDEGAYRQQIGEWQARRETRLKAEDGWLSLVGLYWLKEGRNSVGGDSSLAVVLPPEHAPSSLGTITMTGDSMWFDATPGVDVRVGDSAVSAIRMRPDSDEQGPTILRHGSIRFYLIRRGDQVGVRIKDSMSLNRLQFAGLSFFPIDTRWRVRARYVPYNPPKMSKIATMINTEEDYAFPGALVFTLDGNEYTVDVAIEEGLDTPVFLMFGDLTNGDETYGPGRQLYAALPDSTGFLTLDFNQAYNWPCVYTEYATCPIPPPQNRLPVRIEAGEKLPPGYKEHSQ